MTSFGAKVDDEINKGRGPYVFKIFGQIFHRIGSFCSDDSSYPRFLQLYMCDDENEISNRLRSFHTNGDVVFSVDVINSLSRMLDTHNEYVCTFKTARDMAESMCLDSYGVCLFNNVPDRRYGPPAPGTLGCIVCGDNVIGVVYDIVIYSKSGLPQQVSKLHPTYMPLQYPLLFPYGEDGWSPKMCIRGGSASEERSLTNNMYYSYQIHERRGVYSLILHAQRLFQQYLVDAYTCIEQSRLDYIEHHQQLLRSEYISGVYDALSRGDTDSRVIGKRVFLPASFMGGPRYMYKHYQDALAICRVHGKPRYFITFTCNVRWPEYRRYITAELPDTASEADLYKTVTTCMLHGQCGLLNIRAPCMQDMKCTKHFPKPFLESTTFDENGYVRYRRRSNISHVLHNGIIIDNGYVVPYNKRLCSRFDAHINVEYCRWNMMIKYLFKYISKGVDRVRLTLQKSEGHCGGSTSVAPVALNEIKSFLDGRYICLHEVAWRILNFSIHERYPAVQVLPIHLEGMQPTIFKETARLDTLIDNLDFGVTMLTEWLHNNQKDSRGVGLTYNEYLSKYKWDTRAKAWVHRAITITSTSTTIGRLAYVHPTAGELFYLRILLSHQKGCKSFVDIRTVRGQTYSTFRDACDALGLMGDDKEWLTAFHEAAFSASSSELRSLFCHLLLFCEVGTPLLLWESAKDKMGDDIDGF
ncbi:hypothetical protein Lser_V15G15147 [Lactuca serriola]